MCAPSQIGHQAKFHDFHGGPRNLPKDTHVILEPTLVHGSMCLQFKFELCTLNAQKINYCIKKAKRVRNNSKIQVLIFGLICMCKKIKAGEGSVHMSFRTQRLHVPPSGTTSLLEISSGLQEAYTKACPNSAKNYRSMFMPCHDTMPSFIIFMRVLELHELKNHISRSFRPSHDAQMFEFHSHFLHGTQKFTQGHACDFSTNFGAPEHVLVVQI